MVLKALTPKFSGHKLLTRGLTCLSHSRGEGVQDLSGFDSKDSRSQRGTWSNALEARRPQGPAASPSRSPEPGPLKKGMLSIPSQKSGKPLSIGRRRDGLQEINIDEEQVTAELYSLSRLQDMSGLHFLLVPSDVCPREVIEGC